MSSSPVPVPLPAQIPVSGSSLLPNGKVGRVAAAVAVDLAFVLRSARRRTAAPAVAVAAPFLGPGCSPDPAQSDRLSPNFEALGQRPGPHWSPRPTSEREFPKCRLDRFGAEN